MATRKKVAPRATKVSDVLGPRLGERLQELRGEVDRFGRASGASENLLALRGSAERLRAALLKVSRRRAGDLAERLEELDYPFAMLEAFFARKKTALDRRATEIMAEYLRDRMLEIRIVARSLDTRS